MKKLFVPVLPAILLCGTAMAQSDNTPQLPTNFIGWEASQANSHEVAVTAIIQETVSNHSSGIPSGLHLMLGTPQGVLVASVGPYLRQEVQQALTAGQTVQVIGKVQTIRDQKYLFVRQINLNGQQIAIRNDHGSLVHQQPQARTHTQSLLSGQNGGTK
jgi:hypothetical protein